MEAQMREGGCPQGRETAQRLLLASQRRHQSPKMLARLASRGSELAVNHRVTGLIFTERYFRELDTK
ncbi:unnamed protein product [Protopolystoma xenopodis]|uniref:Uncharacterized protein n=1 Tax=Protopolystoma xenopodis TaxID=117903 RepID=A0A448XCC7_9PLAT|nr:unnamed protein product [Protopolystoma xenopodis]